SASAISWCGTWPTRVTTSPDNISCTQATDFYSTTRRAPSARACNGCWAPTARGGSSLEAERAEVRIAVEVILVLRTLEEAYDFVRHRREEHLDGHLAHELRQHD